MLAWAREYSGTGSENPHDVRSVPEDYALPEVRPQAADEGDLFGMEGLR